MKLQSIETRNLVNIGASVGGVFTTNIPDDVAIFVGRNGSGKSLMLEQIAYSVQGNYSQSMHNLSTTLKNFGNRFQRVSIKSNFDHGFFEVFTDQTHTLMNNSHLRPSNGCCIYVPASRDFTQANDRRLQDIDFTYGEKLFIYDQSQENNFEKILISLSNKEIQAAHYGLGNTREAATLTRIRNAYRIVFPDVELLGAYGHQFIARKNGISYPISASSHGEKQALILLTTLAKEPSLDNSIIIIDEPEIGLSKTIRETLIESIRSLSPSLQILVATHSKEIIESVDLSKVIPVD